MGRYMKRIALIFLALVSYVSFAEGERYVLKNSVKVEVYESNGKYKKTITLKAGTHIAPEVKSDSKKTVPTNNASRKETSIPRQETTTPPRVLPNDNIVSMLEGSQLIADDGQYLGKITWNDVASDSIFNSIGTYGSEISSTSIWNDICSYGSEVSLSSPFNEFSSTPPRIIKDDKVIGYLTVNEVKANAISPIVLLKFLDDSSDKIYRKRLLKYLR